MNSSKRFPFVAVVTTLAASVIVASSITWLRPYSYNTQGVMVTIHKQNERFLVPSQNGYESKIAQESRASPVLPSPLQSQSDIGAKLRSITTTTTTTTRTITPSVMIRTQRSNIAIFLQLNENETHHIFSTNKKSLNPISNINLYNSRNYNRKNFQNTIAFIGTPALSEHMAFVAPTFTTAAYNDRFYVFYRQEENVPHNVNVTKHLNLLTSRVIKLPPQQIKHAFLGSTSNLQAITDEDVDNGSIFINKSGNNTGQSSINKYDVLILAHQEYVTLKEYDNLKHFVANGGTLILLDGNVFYAQVSYDRHHHTITLVKGHGWASNGKSAWKSISERWAKETSKWVGSNFLPCVCPVTFAHDPFEYKHHEEQYITNRNDTILTNYDATLITKQHVSYKPVIATYELHYKKGRVIVLGLYSDDILNNIKFDRYFDTLLMQHTFRQHAISYQR